MLPPSSRRQATVHRTVALDCSNPALIKSKDQSSLWGVLAFWSGLRDSNPRSLGPKPSAIPNFAKPGYEVKIFSDVVKHVVKGYFRPEQGRSQEEKVPAPQRVFGSGDSFGANSVPAPKEGAIPTALWILFQLNYLEERFIPLSCPVKQGDTTPETSAIIHGG